MKMIKRMPRSQSVTVYQPGIKMFAEKSRTLSAYQAQGMSDAGLYIPNRKPNDTHPDDHYIRGSHRSIKVFGPRAIDHRDKSILKEYEPRPTPVDIDKIFGV